MLPSSSSLSTLSFAVIRPGEFVLLHFGDGKQIFAQCLPGKQGGVKINKRTYDTGNLIGLPYGTVLEVHRSKGLIPTTMHYLDTAQHNADDNGDDDHDKDDNDHHVNHRHEEKKDSFHEITTTLTTAASVQQQQRDNRNLVDTNSSQRLSYEELEKMKHDTQLSGRDIVHAIIHNSSTFADKTDFSKAKYIQKKLQKYQPQCRIVPCTPIHICQALYMKEPRKISNLRFDTLAQLLSYANISAGSKVMVMDTPGTLGIVTGSVAKKLNGYGMILAIYDKTQPTCCKTLDRFNLSFAEQSSIYWLHTGEIFTDDTPYPSPTRKQLVDEPIKDLSENETQVEIEKEVQVDYERLEREALAWPCPLQPHTRNWLRSMSTDQDRIQFLDKRCARFARKLTRPTVMEVGDIANDPHRPCDSLILASEYDPTTTLLSLLPFLGPSCPFVVYYEYLEPLLSCFQKIQELGLAIQLRLCDSWMREYQILPGRTHPFMKMSQNGGFLFMGIKVDVDVSNEVSQETTLEQQQTNGKMNCNKREGNTHSNLHANININDDKMTINGDKNVNNPPKRQKIDARGMTERYLL